MIYDFLKGVYDTVGPFNCVLITGVISAVILWKKELFNLKE